MMKIYARYSLDSAEEGQRHADQIGKARQGLRKEYNRIETTAAILVTACIGFAVLLAVYVDSFPAAARVAAGAIWMLGCIAACVALIRLKRKGDAGELDLYIYGMKNGRFFLLNQLYEPMKRITPGEVREIRILFAMRPTTRQRRFGKRYRGENTDYAYVGETRENGRIRAYPMAVACTGKKKINWNCIDDPIRRRQLNHLLTFVPMGDKEAHFVYLLQNSRCPVVIAPKVYQRYRAHLDALFARSGMDMNRVERMKEHTERAKIIKITG